MTNYLELSISIHCADMNCGPRKKEVERTWNVFYHSMPSDSEETDDEDSLMFDSEDEKDADFGHERFNGFMKNAPVGLWIMQAPNGEKEAPNEGKKEQFLDSTDAQESSVEPKLAECVRFCDNPRVHFYEQLNEYESDVFDFRLCQFDKMRRQQRRLNGDSCWDSDTEDEENDETIEFVPRGEAAKKKMNPTASPILPVGSVHVVQYFVETAVLKTCLKNKAVDPPCTLNMNHAEDPTNVTNTNYSESSPETTMNHIEDPYMANTQAKDLCVINMNQTEDPNETNVNNAGDAFEMNMNHATDPNIEHIIDFRATNIKNGCFCEKCGTELPRGTSLVRMPGPSCRCSSRETEAWSRSGCLAKLMCMCGPNSKTKKKLETHPALCEQRVCS